MGHANRLVLFVALVVILASLALSSVGELPERIAIHFAPDGQPDRWTNRETYLLAVLMSLALVPSLLVWMMAGLPRLTDGRGQIPNAEYWFAQERRQATERFLISHASWLGCMTVAIVYAMHLLILRANAVVPPSLATDRFITMVLIYLCGLAWWFVAFMRHFQRVDEHN